MEKRLQRADCRQGAWLVPRRGLRIRLPQDKTPIEKSEVAAGGRDDKDGSLDGKRRRRRRRHLGPPSEVEAALAEEEESAIHPESLADAEAERNGARGQGVPGVASGGERPGGRPGGTRR